MEKRELVCVSCPMGCPITVTLDDDGKVIDVTGNTCKRGDAYARTECTAPVRMLTSTVKVCNGKSACVVPCKSANPIPKEKMMECMEVINKACVEAPVKIGDVLIKDILSTGVDVVATNDAE